MALHIHAPGRDTAINWTIGITATILLVGGFLVMINQKLQLPLLPSGATIGFAMIYAAGITLLLRGLPPSNRQ